MRQTILPLISLLLFSFTISAQNPGDIDEDWAENGTAWFDFGGQYLIANCMGMQSNGKMISAGYQLDVGTMESDMIAIRINQDGSLDDFGNMGDHFLLDNSSVDNAKCMYINENDDIFLVSSTILTDIYKLDQNGEMDLSYGESGVASTSKLSDVQSIYPFPFETFEHLLLCGSTINPGETSPGLCVIFEDGTENEYFWEDGVAAIEGVEGYFSDACYVPEDEAIYACGIKFESVYRLLIAKFDFQGELDASFGDGGYIVEDFPTGVLEFYNPKLIYDDVHDHLIIGSHILWAEGDTDIQLRKVDSNGDPVYYFGSDGWVHVTMPYTDEVLSSIALQEDGMLYFAGSTASGDTEDFLMGKVDMDGYLDENFGDNGIVIHDHMSWVNQSNDIILNPDEGRLILGGSSRTEDHTQSAMAVSKFFTGVYTELPDENTHSNKEIKISPNPITNSRFLISIPDQKCQSYKIDIVSVDGKLEYRTSINLSGGSAKISLPFISNGLYLLNIECDNQSYSSKIMVHNK